MKVIAAYLLAVLGGNISPTGDDLKSILESGLVGFLLLMYFHWILSFLHIDNQVCNILIVISVT